jgi:hypothetical protein
VSRSNLLHVLNRCVHFTGTQHRVCKAGVVYAEVRGPAGGGIPCLRDLAGDLTCAKAEWPTEEQAAAEVKERDERVAELLKRLDEGRCGQCGADVDHYEQAGRCVYAKPCGHRGGQGDAKVMNRSLAKMRAAAPAVR